MNFERGDRVVVKERKSSERSMGLHYPAGIYTMQEDGVQGGWDVWDCVDPNGEETCIYGFSIEGFAEEHDHAN